MSDGDRISVLLVGPMPPCSPSNANPIGGASVNFTEMVRSLRARKFDLLLVDITRPRVNLKRWMRWRSDISAVVRIVRSVLHRIRDAQVVVVNISAGTTWSFGSAMWLLCTLVRRPMILRLFGGDFAIRYDRYGRFIRWWADHTYMRSDVVFVQTKSQLSRFVKKRNFRWFANTRDVRVRLTASRRTISRFLFVSQLRLEKGLRETLDACRDLPGYCQLNIYGPAMPNTDFGLLEGHPVAKYRGTLRPSEVPEVIVQHDVLLLPTYWRSEGYPGIVLEALQCGRPVITTSWGSIPEIVEDEKSGLLVEPRSAAAVKRAIERLMDDTALYERLCKGAQSRGEFFRSDAWYDRMAKEIWRVVGRP